MAATAPRVLISDKLSPAAVDIFRQRGITVDLKPGLSPAELHDARVAGGEVLREVEAPTPSHTVIRRALAMVKGILGPIALGVTSGAGEGAQELTKTAIEHLTHLYV